MEAELVACARPEVLVERTPARSWWRLRAVWPRIELLLCFVAVMGLALTLVNDYEHVKTLSPVATDYKTVYASSALFANGGNPYDMKQLVGMYRADGVVLPENMFGHMPVYPPITLLVLWPLAKLTMAKSAVAWLVLSIGMAGAALTFVLREAREQGLGWGYRLAVLAFAVSAPVLGFALDIGNVSPAASALAIIALIVAIRESQRFAGEVSRRALAGSGICLGLALCLKPHLAIWVAAAIALVCGRAGRRIAASAGRQRNLPGAGTVFEAAPRCMGSGGDRAGLRTCRAADRGGRVGSLRGVRLCLVGRAADPWAGRAGDRQLSGDTAERADDRVDVSGQP